MSLRNTSARLPRTVLGIEQLEDRRMLSGFSFADFSDASDLNLLGAAAISEDNRLRLTPAVGNRAGAAWYITEKQGLIGGFTTTFQFQLNVDGPEDGSDGLAFALQNSDPSFLGGPGGGLGYDGLPNSLAVEFDTWQNGEFSDPSPSHISVHTAGTNANNVHESFSLGSFGTNPRIDDTQIHTARIEYLPGILSIFLDDLNSPVLTVDVNLFELLSLDSGTGWVGFSAGTGGDSQTHDILNWEFGESDEIVTPISISDVSQAEGASGTSAFVFTVTRGGDVSGATTVDWTIESGTATAPGDYIAASGQVSFAAGETSMPVSVTVKGDAATEGNETFVVRLSNAVGGGIVDSTGKGTILNDDANVSISDAALVAEGNAATFTVTLSAAAGIPVVVDYTLADGSALAGEDFDGAPGSITFAPGQTQRTITIPTINDDLYEPGIEDFFVNLTLVTAGPTILDGQGRGTISSEDPKPTKFYVVNDAALNQAFKYAADSDSVGANSLAAANTAPRGVVSNAAGDRVWVIDASRKVFVYDKKGALLGSWIASGLAASAQPQGIATDGNDVWIVDAKSGKVLRYAGAASRLSGSQNFAGSFNLVNQNSNPTDLVTDGGSLWVVNNLAVDKVFKYTLGGSLLGRWVIDATNSTPTGITIDPTDVGDMWIVDNASNRVFQYADAASRTNGSQLAFASFALAPGNTNPQGIADPPATGVAPVVSASVQSSELAVAQQFTEAGKQTNKKAREAAFAQEMFWRAGI